MSKLYQIQTFHNFGTCRVLVPTIDLQYYPVVIKDTTQQIAGEAINFSSPVVLTAVVVIEGTDYPFFTRDGLVRGDTPQLKQKRKAWQRFNALKTDGLGMPMAIMDLPPDTTPVVVGKVFEGPQRNWALRKKAASLAAGRATSDAPGYWAERIPATSYSAGSCELLSDIQRIMLEGIIDEGRTWSLWTQAEVLAYLNQRIVRFLMETGLIRKRETISATSTISEYDLASDVIDIRRAAWNTGSAHSVLGRTDEMVFDTGSPGWETSSGVPYAYSDNGPLSIKVIPTPNANGTIELVVVARPDEVTGVCSILVLPSLFTPFVKWGVIADMLSKQGEANDPQRASYAESRFTGGVEIARLLLGASS